MAEPVFNRTELQRAFTALAANLERRCVVGHVHVVGGAAMLLAYDCPGDYSRYRRLVLT